MDYTRDKEPVAWESCHVLQLLKRCITDVSLGNGTGADRSVKDWNWTGQTACAEGRTHHRLPWKQGCKKTGGYVSSIGSTGQPGLSGMSHVCYPLVLVWLNLSHSLKLVTKPNWSSLVVATCVLRWELKQRRRRRERQITKKRFIGFHTGHGKPGKSWNLSISFSRPGKTWNLIVSPWESWKIVW